MRTSLLARGRRLRVAVCLALVCGLGGCAAASSTVTVSGNHLTIYVSLPPRSAGTQETQDVYSAEQLAFRQAGQIGRFTVRLVPVQGQKLSDNARTAIQDTSAIAYLGEVAPGSSADTLGINNGQGLLQVSPTDTAVALTQATPAVPDSPKKYYESLKTYGRTFARMVPSTALEAKALVSEMQTLGVTKLWMADDGSDYGKALARAVKDDLGSSISTASTQAAANGILYAGSSRNAAATLFNQAAMSNAGVKLLAPSALAERAFVSALSPAAQRVLHLSAPGFYKDLPAAGKTFESQFKATFGHAPAPEAIFGYEAMASVLAVLREAGSAAGNRATVVRDYFAIRNRDSVLGTYSMNSNGDTSLDVFTASRVEHGVLVPFKSLADQG